MGKQLAGELRRAAGGLAGPVLEGFRHSGPQPQRAACERSTDEEGYAPAPGGQLVLGQNDALQEDQDEERGQLPE